MPERAERRTWSIVTPHFPPDAGGVADYTQFLARGLAGHGDRVQVHTRGPGNATTPGVEIELLPDDFGRRSREALARAWRELPEHGVVLVQYVPQAFSRRTLNVRFAHWLGTRAERVWLVFHEIAYPFVPGQTLRRHAFAALTRLTLSLASRGAERAFFSTPAWEPLFERYAGTRVHGEWLPVWPHIEPGCVGAPARESPRPSVAHFGTHGPLVTEALERTLVPLLERNPELELVLLGQGSREYGEAFGRRTPALASRVRALGPLEPAEVARELASAWVTLFPFNEGVTTRRSSVMAALASGAVVVTTDAWCTELVWRKSGAVELVPPGVPERMAEATERLLGDATRRTVLRERARALYEERFTLEHAVSHLRALYGR